jgi:hypothetical protein
MYKPRFHNCYFCKKRVSGNNVYQILSGSGSGASMYTMVCSKCMNRIGEDNILDLLDDKLTELDKIQTKTWEITT